MGKRRSRKPGGEKKSKKIQKKTKPRKKKKQRLIPTLASVYIKATFNNTIITVADKQGDTLLWGTAGSSGFRGTKKSTPFAAGAVGRDVGKKALRAGIREVNVFVKGPGFGRDGAIRALRSAGLRILSLTDTTPIPHNGCRPKKRRRV